MGRLRYRRGCDIEGSSKSVTVTPRSDGWYMSIMAASELKVPCTATAIGAADRGITNFLLMDTGCLVAPVDAHKHLLYTLCRYQRAVARRIECAKIAHHRRLTFRAIDPWPLLHLQHFSCLRRSAPRRSDATSWNARGSRTTKTAALHPPAKALIFTHIFFMILR